MELINVSELSKHFAKGEVAVDRISFQLNEGGCCALLGPNGAGKTTTLKMLSGLLNPTNGTIQFKGLKKGVDLRQYIGYLPQSPRFYAWMSGREFLEYAGKLAYLSASEARKRASQLLELVGLSDAARKRIGTYSGGMRQRLGIAQAMVHEPRLLMLDEPVSALDPIGRREVLGMMEDLKKETTILFSTHVLNDAEEVSEQVLIMNKGEIVVDRSLKQLRKEYQQPLILLQSEEPLENWIGKWERWELVKEIVYEGETAKITVTDLEQGKKRILHEIVTKNIPIHKYEVGHSTLEDMFMKVVRT